MSANSAVILSEAAYPAEQCGRDALITLPETRTMILPVTGFPVISRASSRALFYSLSRVGCVRRNVTSYRGSGLGSKMK